MAFERERLTGARGTMDARCRVDGGGPEHGDAVASEEVQRLLQLTHQGVDAGGVAADQDSAPP